MRVAAIDSQDPYRARTDVRIATAERRRRFVVLCLQGFGDALEATPLVEQLRENAPSAEIAVVTMRPQVRELYEGLPELADRVLYVPFWERGAIRALPAIAELRSQTRSEASFLAYPAARAEYGLFAHAIGSVRHFSHDYRYSRVTATLQRRSVTLVPIAHKHNVLRNLDLLAAAGFRVSQPAGYLVPRRWNAERVPSRRVLMHVGSIAHHGLEAKRWPAESFLELGRMLKSASIDVALLSGPNEREETERIARLLDDAEIVTGSIADVARAMARFGAVVANDNGMAHLAAGVRTPVVALMGPTPEESGPYGPRAIAFRPSPCPPCFDPRTTDMRCVRNIDYACLKRDLTPRNVFTLVAKAVGEP